MKVLLLMCMCVVPFRSHGITSCQIIIDAISFHDSVRYDEHHVYQNVSLNDACYITVTFLSSFTKCTLKTT